MSWVENLNDSGFNLKRFLAITSIVLLIGYAIFNAKHLITGPSIEIFNPTTEELETSKNIFAVKGRALNVTMLKLNDRQISIDTEGFFEEKLLLSEGFNIINIEARDRFGKKTLKSRQIYYKPSNDGESLDNT